jgi:transposase
VAERNQKYQNNSFPGKGRPKMTDLESEVARLRKELRDAKMERDILKKAVSIFSRSDGKSTNS